MPTEGGIFRGVPFDKSDGFGFQITLPTDHGRTDGVFNVILPSIPLEIRPDDDEVLIAFEHVEVADGLTNTFLFGERPIDGRVPGLDDYWG